MSDHDSVQLEETCLIERHNSYRKSYSCKNFQLSFVHSRGTVVVIAWSLLLGLIFHVSMGVLVIHLRDVSFLKISSISIMVCYVLYPVFGLLGEKWMRFKVVAFGSLILLNSYIALMIVNIIISYQTVKDTSIVIEIIQIFATVIFILSHVLVGANIIQFGLDQLQFSPSYEIGNYIHWHFLTFYVCAGIDYLILSIVTPVTSSDPPSRVTLVMFGTGLAAIAVFFCFAIYFRCHLILDKAQNNNPVKLIWNVTRYCLKHRKPVSRSAFTYGESIPTGLDIAKERFGGSFTTVMVENVKSFWYLFFLLLTTYGFVFIDSTVELSLIYTEHLKLNNASSMTFLQSITLWYNNTVNVFTVIIGLLIYQLIIVPFFSSYIPSMIKQIWFGLVIVVIQLGTATVISSIVNERIENVNGTENWEESSCINIAQSNITIQQLPNYRFLLIPQFLGGVATICVFVKIGCFIVAQGPYDMKGLLIGLWLSFHGFFGLHILSLVHSFTGCIWYYYAIKTIIATTSVVAFSIAAYKYKYRQCNEISDINERSIITKYTERYLNNCDKINETSPRLIQR